MQKRTHVAQMHFNGKIRACGIREAPMLPPLKLQILLEKEKLYMKRDAQFEVPNF